MLKVNQIYKDLITMIQTALTSNGLNWQVIQNYQQTMGNLKAPFIMLHRLTSTNYGWQYGKDKTVDGQHIHTENQIEEMVFQIEAYKPRSKNETANTITGADVVRLLACWFMSEVGLKAIRDKGYDVLRITDVVEEYYKEVNEVYQVNPHFKMRITALQTDNYQTNTIKGVIGTVKEVEQLKNNGGIINANIANKIC